MKDEGLLKVSLGVAILGLIGLFLVGQQASATGYAIAELNDGLLDRTVVVRGVVSTVKSTEEGHSFLTVSDGTGSIRVVAFAGSKLEVPEQGAQVEVRGRLQEYKGRLEIVAEAIKSWG